MMEHDTQPPSFRIEWGKKTLSISAAQVYDHSKDSHVNIGTVTVFRDFTREAEVERLKSTFVAIVSHELRTPLNAIIGFSELMLDEKFGPVGNERYRDYLRDINRSGNHVLDLVNDLLDISKIEAGEQEMSHEAVPLNDTLAETVAMMQPQANRERVIIRSSFASRLPDVVADLRSVRQIALNLLSNACKFTERGTITLDAARDGSGRADRFFIRVSDTGIGMTEEQIGKLFQPFSQAEVRTTRKYGGTGLGLSVSYGIIAAHGGELSLAPDYRAGARFRITLPAGRTP